MSSLRTVVVTGSTGLVGSALVRSLEADGVRVIRLVRRPVRDPQREAFWDPAAGKIDVVALEGVEAAFHLAGKGIAESRWTPRVKREILDSRVQGTTLLARALAGLDSKPTVMVSASAIGYYGDRGAEPVDEDSPPGVGFLADTCRAWEGACRPAWEGGIRVAQVRIGIVLSKEGGALAKMLPVFRWGLGGVLGSGAQYMSWVALSDLVRALRFVADSPMMHGAVNGVAPGAVTNREFTRVLGGQLGKPTVAPAPGIALRVAVGEMARPLLLEGANVRPKRLEQAGFRFELPDLAEALRGELAGGPAAAGVA
ncbi:MAG: TIGR01777 family oxidoreductase [Lacipirellulaceae bacterium]